MSGIRNLTSPQRPVTAERPEQPAPAQPAATPARAGGTDNFVQRPGAQGPDLAPSPPPLTPLAPAVRSTTAQTVSASVSPQLSIGDNAKVQSSLELAEDLSIEKLALDLDIPHSWKGDLVVTLTSPSGKSAVVHNRTGGSADNVAGKFDLTAFAGESAKGKWTLTVEDKARGDVGTLNSWGLSATGTVVAPPPPPPKPSAGEPIVVVLDGGVDVKHTDLDEALFVNAGETAGDGIDNDQNGIVDDVHGFNVGFGNGDVFKGRGTDHGTHVAGIIAAEDNQVGNTGFAAGKAKVMSIGGLYDGADLLTNFEKAVDYMVQMKEAGNNIRVVNASFGDEYKNPAEVQRWEAAVAKLEAADILLVAATANGNGSNMNNVSDMPANIDRPNVITIAAMNSANEKLASFSSHGDKVVELAAVGENVLSTVPGNRHQTMSGTSMATPTVAAAAALIFATNPDLTAADARRILIETVDKDSDLNGKVSTGGKLNLQRAVEAARATLPKVPSEAQTRDWFRAV